MDQNSILQQVLDTIKSSNKLPIVVFDLDDTLFSTARRNLIIIQNFSSDSGDAYPDFVEIASKLSLLDMNWSVTAALEKAGLSPASPSIKPFVEYWGSTFFTNDYDALDLPNPGAVDFAKACHDAGALLYYLTGRAIGDSGLNNGMGQGTVLALTNRGFPFWRGRCELHLKINAKEQDSEYKARALTDIKSLQGKVVATFDNEPSNSFMFLNHFPDALNVWVKTTWNPQDKSPTDNLYTISDFSRTANQKQ
ncbi:hypothetical protein [Gillisia limnaea]|uniref:Uncharacterized protein n=1 Tax=Gillisia limnaea (strain DSM 15749 / LMG 21470 / R-8282) TaxID=865937 RepID=H2BSY6_GILLR|nr:hypothetical protein [Gillisia limnaea]EHQ01516.1 hypothetical protein Gilli_0819 [Gillisia limnaea DSM 15749]